MLSRLLLLVLAFFYLGCEEEGYPVTTRSIPVSVGETVVEILVHETGVPGINGVNMHDDENTSVTAALAVLGERGGRLVELQHAGTRNVTFALGDTVYAFDPNRIFTREGAAATLRREGPYSEAALLAVRAFADAFLEEILLDEAEHVVALHNNTDDEYSTLSYTGGGEYAGDAQFVHLTSDIDPDDFFFVTDLVLYNEMRDGGFNVVLQDNLSATDDGSLSVFSGRTGIPYVNVEAEHGHFEQQVEMLSFLHELLFESRVVSPES